MPPYPSGTYEKTISPYNLRTPLVIQPHVETLGDGSSNGTDGDQTRNPIFDRSKQKAILHRYRIASRQIFCVLRKHAPLCEKASIDEAFLDVTPQAISRLKSQVLYAVLWSSYTHTICYSITGRSWLRFRRESCWYQSRERRCIIDIVSSHAGGTITLYRRKNCARNSSRRIGNAPFHVLGWYCRQQAFGKTGTCVVDSMNT